MFSRYRVTNARGSVHVPWYWIATIIAEQFSCGRCRVEDLKTGFVCQLIRSEGKAKSNA